MAIKGSNSITIIVGALSRDPEMRYTPSGQAVTTFSIPVNRVWYDKESNKMTEVTWNNVTTWGKLAENCNKFLRKGAIVQVVGRIKPDTNGHPRIWTRQDGTPGSSFEITAGEVTFVYVENGEAVNQDMSDGIPDEDDIPF
jgi:single-strand DNA-binding protein